MKTELDLNKKYGKWTVLAFDKVDERRCRRYLCRCECGLEKSMKASVIASGDSRSCRKCKRADLTGKTFGRWEVLGRHPESSKSKHILWICKCTCGKTGTVERCNLVRGGSKGCWECQRNVIHAEYFPKAWYRKQIEQAKLRGHAWSLEEEYLWAIWTAQKEKCPLTGLDLKISKDAKEMSASLDRMDSAIGYEPGNVWFIHKHVNLMKYKFELSYFKKMCSFISEKGGNVFSLGNIIEWNGKKWAVEAIDRDHDGEFISVDLLDISLLPKELKAIKFTAEDFEHN